MKDIAVLPAEKQVEAVSKKLMEFNSGFDWKVTDWDFKGAPKVESGHVAEIGFSTENVSDLSPVLALPGLKKLFCQANPNAANRILCDLSPLRALPLTHLDFLCSNVADLSPLAGMRLEHLVCSVSSVADLSPLRGIPLTCLARNQTLHVLARATRAICRDGMPPNSATWLAAAVSVLGQIAVPEPRRGEGGPPRDPSHGGSVSAKGQKPLGPVGHRAAWLVDSLGCQDL